MKKIVFAVITLIMLFLCACPPPDSPLPPQIQDYADKLEYAESELEVALDSIKTLDSLIKVSNQAIDELEKSSVKKDAQIAKQISTILSLRTRVDKQWQLAHKFYEEAENIQEKFIGKPQDTVDYPVVVEMFKSCLTKYACFKDDNVQVVEGLTTAYYESLKKANQEVEVLKKRVAELEDKLIKEQKRYDDLKKKYDGMEKDYATTRQLLASANSQIENLEDQIKTIKVQMKKLIGDNKQLQQSLAEKENELADLKTSVRQYENDMYPIVSLDYGRIVIPKDGTSEIPISIHENSLLKKSGQVKNFTIRIAIGKFDKSKQHWIEYIDVDSTEEYIKGKKWVTNGSVSLLWNGDHRDDVVITLSNRTGKRIVLKNNKKNEIAYDYIIFEDGIFVKGRQTCTIDNPNGYDWGSH